MKINPTQKLSAKLWELAIEQVPTRTGFGEGLLQAAAENEQVVALTADLKESTKVEAFANKYPARFFDLGVAEQNLAGVASGLAAMGKIPFMTSYAVFSPGRNWEQIRTTICYNNRNVKIVGSHAGLSVGPDGGSHQALEDLALTRVLPNLVVLSPADALEAAKATVAAAKFNGPVYLRLARAASPVFTTDETPFAIGQAQLLVEASKPQVGLIATGPLVYQALRAAKKLFEEHIEVSVLNVATIKPLDELAIVTLAKQAKAILTIEEHQQTAGLGGAVAELLARTYPVPMEFIGVDNRFGQSGEPAELFEHYGLSVRDMMEKTKILLARKTRS